MVFWVFLVYFKMGHSDDCDKEKISLECEVPCFGNRIESLPIMDLVMINRVFLIRPWFGVGLNKLRWNQNIEEVALLGDLEGLIKENRQLSLF